MKKFIMMLMLVFVGFLPVISQGIDSTMFQLKPWEKLGTTSKEWHEAQLRGFSDDSIKYIISYGINISEFFKKPWNDLNLTCEQWINYRKTGLTDKEIYLKLNKITQTDSTSKIEWNNTEQQYNNVLKLQSFALPGYIQLLHYKNRSQKVMGVVMGTLAITGVAGTICWCIKDKAFMPTPFIIVTLPVMFWSYFNARQILN